MLQEILRKKRDIQRKKMASINESAKGVEKEKSFTQSKLLSLAAKLDDPYVKLGYGMVAYRKVLKLMVFIFFILSLIMSPCIYIYS